MPRQITRGAFCLLVLSASVVAAGAQGSNAEERWIEQVTRQLEEQGFEVRVRRGDGGERTFEVLLKQGASLRGAVQGQKKRDGQTE